MQRSGLMVGLDGWLGLRIDGLEPRVQDLEVSENRGP